MARARIAPISSRTWREPLLTASRIWDARSKTSMSEAPRQESSARRGARRRIALACARLVSWAAAAPSKF
eukprot:scaffold171044_cov30-Tisochrysis_lutea.AAC.9